MASSPQIPAFDVLTTARVLATSDSFRRIRTCCIWRNPELCLDEDSVVCSCLWSLWNGFGNRFIDVSSSLKDANYRHMYFSTDWLTANVTEKQSKALSLVLENRRYNSLMLLARYLGDDAPVFKVPRHPIYYNSNTCGEGKWGPSGGGAGGSEAVRR